jgi:hypothetical protein
LLVAFEGIVDRRLHDLDCILRPRLDVLRDVIDQRRQRVLRFDGVRIGRAAELVVHVVDDRFQLRRVLSRVGHAGGWLHARRERLVRGLRIAGLGDVTARLHRAVHRALDGVHVQGDDLLDALDGLAGQRIEGLHLQVEQGFRGVGKLFRAGKHGVSPQWVSCF